MTTGSPSSASSKQVVYRGGIARFEIPSSWVEEYEPEGGGTFYEPRDDSGTLRLNVLSFSSASDPSQEMARSALKDANGRSGEGFPLHYEVIEATEGDARLEIHRWQVAVPVLPHSVRLAIFSYTILSGQRNDPHIANEWKFVDASLRKATFSTEPGADPSHDHQGGMTQRIEPLNDEDNLRVAAQRKWVVEHYEPHAQHEYETLAGKLNLLNTIVSERWVEPGETAKLQSLGIALGDAFVQELGMCWVAVEDEFGRDPALELPGTSVLIFPLTMISKRIERGEEVNVLELFEGVCARVREVELVADSKREH